MKKLEDTKGVVKKAVNRRTDNTMLKRKRIKGQTTIYKTQDRSLKIEQHYPTKKTRDEFRCSTSSRKNSGVLRAPERIQVFYELQKGRVVAPVLLLLNDTNIGIVLNSNEHR
jgi:hypothetical protein